MPRGRPSRSQRRRVRRPPAVPPPRYQPVPAAPAPAEAQPATPAARRDSREASITRFTSRDYTYVKREFRRIVILASAIIITIVVLSFFLP